MKIHFIGAAQTVTGSQHLLEVNGYQILLDCGLYQGKRKQAFERNRNLNLDPSKLDAVILSHAHIDHSGNLPTLSRAGYAGPIYAQHATIDLAKVMLLDAAYIQEADVRYVNKYRKQKGKRLFEPLYTQQDAEQVSRLFIAQDYDQPFEVVPGVTARLVEAGHILGSAAIQLDIEENGREFRLWFSGDIGRVRLPILRDPVLPVDADYLLMESTYGDKPHAPPEEAYIGLRDIIQTTLRRGGKVLIPAFAVGRTQELVYDIHKMLDAGEIPPVPVYVDSPLAVNVTDVFKAHRECFDEEAWEMIRSDRHRQALGFDLLTYTRSVEESKALNTRKDPLIIISASGMVEHGRILHHLKNNVDDPLSTVLIVSWQAPHTLGRRLVEKQEFIKIFGKTYKRRIQVEVVKGFSAHGGQNFLKKYALAVKDTVKAVYLVHGEERGAYPLMELLRAEGMSNVHFPAPGTVVEI
jgi:metallo-beta-lactamase family protein